MADSPDLALLVMWDEKVLLDVCGLKAMRVLHEANFAVARLEGKLVVYKERYERGLAGKEVTHEEMFEHALRHVRHIRASKRPGKESL